MLGFVGMTGLGVGKNVSHTVAAVGAVSLGPSCFGELVILFPRRSPEFGLGNYLDQHASVYSDYLTGHICGIVTCHK